MATPLVEPIATPPASPSAIPEVAPTDPNAVVPPPVEGTSPAEESSPLPDELIQIPAFQGLLAGSPGAVSAPIEDFAKRPEGQLIQQHKNDLLAAGIGLYRSLAGDLGVLFNQAYINGEDLKTADKEGKLTEVAPSFDEVNQQLAGSGDAHPILNAQPPTGIKQPGAPSVLPPVASTEGAPPAGPMAPPTPQKAIGQKMRNLALGSPTSGPAPGQGRILNSILKPVL